jgi:hypothetical protein
LGESFINGSGASRREGAVVSGYFVIASEAKQSILSLRGEMDCFAPLAMTVPSAHSRDPLARNDGLQPNYLWLFDISIGDFRNRQCR